MQSCTRHMLWYRFTFNRLSRSLYMFSVLGYKFKMEKKMIHPKIKGIVWQDAEIPEIIAVPITLEEKKFLELGLDNIKPPSIQIMQYIDLSKLAGLRPWFGKDAEEPSEEECLVDIEGMVDFVVDVPLKNMLKAWLYYKHWKNSRR